MHRRTFMLGAASALTGYAFAGPHDGTKPFPAYRILGNVYYVGGDDITSYLITSSDGHALVNSGFEETVPIIQDGIQKLGFHLKDVKYLLNSQAHNDHVAGQPLLKAMTGAKVVVSEGDAEVVATGGRGDFRWEDKVSWRPCKVDRIIHDGDTISLGGTTLTARITPGHTKGCTTWTFPVSDGGKQYLAVIVGGTTFFSSDVLVHNPKYPQIADDYARTFQILRALPCDLFLGAHGQYYGMQEKYECMKKGASVNPFLDYKGYLAFVDEWEQAFKAERARQLAGTKTKTKKS